VEFFDYDPDYPIDDGNEDGLDPITRDELRRIEDEESHYDDEVPDLPW
jgi:hypothetical protein